MKKEVVDKVIEITKKLKEAEEILRYLKHDKYQTIKVQKHEYEAHDFISVSDKDLREGSKEALIVYYESVISDLKEELEKL